MSDVKKCMVCDCKFSPPFAEYTSNMCAECYTRVHIQLQIEKVLIPKPIDMILYCPACGLQHIDAPEGGQESQPDGSVHTECVWENPPHRSHLCHGCGCIWRPADVPTNGVLHIKTKGENDNRIFSRNAQPAKEITK